MKLLLIDGNNLSFRVHWTHKHLSMDGMPVSLLYGFFQSLLSLKKNYPEYGIVIAWDGGYKRRFIESAHATLKGLIPNPYKATRPNVVDKNRKVMEENGWTPEMLNIVEAEVEPLPDIESMFEQMPTLREALKFARVLQVEIEGYEADDVIFSYVKKNDAECENTIVVSSDEDFYQLISDNASVFDAMKSNFWTRKVFMDSYGFEPNLWVDVGALMGEKGDNIHSVKGIGKTYATKFIREFGNIDNVFAALEAKPKRGKKEQSILDNKEKIRLAYSLKKMDVVDVPKVRIAPRSKDSLVEWFKQYRFMSFVPHAWRLV